MPPRQRSPSTSTIIGSVIQPGFQRSGPGAIKPFRASQSINDVRSMLIITSTGKGHDTEYIKILLNDEHAKALQVMKSKTYNCQMTKASGLQLSLSYQGKNLSLKGFTLKGDLYEEKPFELAKVYFSGLGWAGYTMSGGGGAPPQKCPMIRVNDNPNAAQEHNRVILAPSRTNELNSWRSQAGNGHTGLIFAFGEDLMGKIVLTYKDHQGKRHFIPNCEKHQAPGVWQERPSSSSRPPSRDASPVHRGRSGAPQ